MLDYVARGEVDAALVYRTDARLLPDAVVVGPEAPTASPIMYVGSVPGEAPRPELGRDVLAFVVSADGQSILARFGFAPAER